MKLKILLLSLALVSPLAGSTLKSRLQRIKHVVVLVQENRSFDHIFGFLDHPSPHLDGLRGKEARYFNHLDPNNSSSPVEHVGTGAPFVSSQDPGHAVASVTYQLFGKKIAKRPYPKVKMNGFFSDAYTLYDKDLSFAKEIMHSFEPKNIPILSQLAKEYAVFDRWFASVPGPTQPNRAYIHSATSHGESDNAKKHMILGYPQKTIYKSLKDSKKSFKIYFHDAPSALLFADMRTPSMLAGHIDPFEGVLGLGGFKYDCKHGRLPAFSFIEPQYYDHKNKLTGKTTYASDDHPPHDMRRGEALIKEIYEAVRSSPSWEETLLLITFDEHGGYYDHVLPPDQGVPNPDGKVADGINFDRLGVRVPTIAISPWIKKGTIVHGPKGPFKTSQYEHSSIAATVKKLFGLKSFLTRRDRWAGTFEHLWADSKHLRTDCPMTLVDVPGGLFEKRSLDKTPSINNEVVLTDMQEALVYAVSGLRNVTIPEEPGVQGSDGGEGVKMRPATAREFVVNNWEQWLKENKLKQQE